MSDIHFDGHAEPAERVDFAQPYRGSVERPTPVLELGPTGPWQATVTVTPLRMFGYEDVRWEVSARWKGPPLPGTPTPAPGVKVNACDSFHTTDQEEAKEIAHRAYELLQSPAVPDLRELSRDVRQRLAGERTVRPEWAQRRIDMARERAESADAPNLE